MKPDLLKSAAVITGRSCVEKEDGIYFWEGNDEASIEKVTHEQMLAIQNSYNEELSAYNNGEYQRDRATAYPSIADQLDMLYHDIKAGTLDTGAWIQAIEAVKTEYPKP